MAKMEKYTVYSVLNSLVETHAKLRKKRTWATTTTSTTNIITTTERAIFLPKLCVLAYETYVFSYSKCIQRTCADQHMFLHKPNFKNLKKFKNLLKPL